MFEYLQHPDVISFYLGHFDECVTHLHDLPFFLLLSYLEFFLVVQFLFFFFLTNTQCTHVSKTFYLFIIEPLLEQTRDFNFKSVVDIALWTRIQFQACGGLVLWARLQYQACCGLSFMGWASISSLWWT